MKKLKNFGDKIFKSITTASEIFFRYWIFVILYENSKNFGMEPENLVFWAFCFIALGSIMFVFKPLFNLIKEYIEINKK